MIIDTHAHYDDEQFDADREMCIRDRWERIPPFFLACGEKI